MSKILAIKGDKERGNEVIALLEMLGGINCHNLYGDENYACYIIENGVILYGPQIEKDTVIYTLDKFYKKYPYKVGDIVKTGKDEEGVIKEMRWVDNDIVYWVNSHKTCDWTQTLSVDILDKYNRLNSNDIEHSMDTKVETTGFMKVGKIVGVIFNDANYEDEVELQLGDYEIEVRDGKTYAVKKKPVYPKTYEECWKVRFEVDDETILEEFHHVSGYYSESLGALQKLLCCRDAYWKIAGDEMGLGKPWEPKFGKTVLFDITFYLYQDNLVLHKGEYSSSDICILAFPTEEMRDAFYENFKDLIEKCKELL